MLKKLLILSALTFSFSTAAKTVWSDFSLSYLSGSDYEVGDNTRNILTFERASGTTWGDTFLFFDRLESSNDDVETYGEFTARYKMTDLDGFIKAVYVAPSIEMGAFVDKSSGTAGFSSGFTNYLLGVGTDLNVPGFAFFQANAFLRNNEFGDNSQQLTIVWGLPLGPLWYDGFMDYATSTGGASKASMNLTSQLKYDIAPHLGAETKVYVGVEYVFWNNKFGIDGVDERNVNLLVKYHF